MDKALTEFRNSVAELRHMVTSPDSLEKKPEMSGDEWRESEAAHRQWLESQKKENDRLFAGDDPLEKVLADFRNSVAELRQSMEPSQNKKPEPAVEDRRKSEAAYRQWIKPQKEK